MRNFTKALAAVPFLAMAATAQDWLTGRSRKP